LEGGIQMTNIHIEGQSGETSSSTKKNIWPIFISYRRSEFTRKIAVWLKDALESKTIEATTGQIFNLDVFVDAAEAYHADFQANLVPHLRHSRALILIIDEAAAARRPEGTVDYLYEELDWWAAERKRTPPIILQVDAQSAIRFVANSKYESWRKVNFLDCFYEKWTADAKLGDVEQTRLLKLIRDSIRDYGQVIHLEEVRRLKRRALLAFCFAGVALIAGLAAALLANDYAKEKSTALANLETANGNLADSYAQRGESLAQSLDFTTCQFFFARALQLKSDRTLRDRMSQAWQPQPLWLWTVPPPSDLAPTSQVGDNIVSLASGPADLQFVSGYNDGTLALFNSSGSLIHNHKTPSPITSITTIRGRNEIVTVHQDNKLRFWRGDNLDIIREFPLTSMPLVVKVSPKEDLVAVGYSGAGIAFFTLPDLVNAGSADAHGIGVSAIAFDPVRNVAYWAGGGEYVWVYDFQEKAPERGMPKRGWTRALSVQPSGEYLNIGGEDRIVGLLDLEKSQSLKAQDNDCEISSSCFSTDGQALAVGDVNGKVRLFSMTLGKAFANLPKHPGPIQNIVITDDGKIITACSDGCVRAWTFPKPETIRFAPPISEMKQAFDRFKEETGKSNPLDVNTGRYDPSVAIVFFKSIDAPLKAFLSDGRLSSWLGSSTPGETIRLCELPFGQSGSSSSGRIAVLTGLLKKDLNVFDLQDSNKLIFTKRISEGLGGYIQVALSDDGRYVACGLTNNAIDCWQLADKKLVREAPPIGSVPTTLSLSPSGDAVMAGYDSGQIVILNNDDSLSVRTNIATTAITCSFIVNKTHFLFCAGDHLFCYDPSAKNTTWNFAANATSIAVDPLQQWVAIGTFDGEINIIDLETGLKIITFEREGEGAEGVTFDTAGNFIAWGDRRGKAFIRSLKGIRQIHSETASNLYAISRNNGGFEVDGANVRITRKGNAK
jgi:WD40 repeat protein